MAARFVALVLLGLANAVAAQPRATSDAPGYDAGLQAYLAGDPAAAWFLWFGLAERGDAEAQFSMGHLYRVGEGVPPGAERVAEGEGVLEELGKLVMDSLG